METLQSGFRQLSETLDGLQISEGQPLSFKEERLQDPPQGVAARGAREPVSCASLHRCKRNAPEVIDGRDLKSQIETTKK